MSERERIIANLKEIALVIAETFGRNCEVAVHDFALLPNSLVHIEGEVTRRKPGAPITDLVLRELRQKGDAVEHICNYQTISQDGRVMKSSTAFARDAAGRVVGALCINFCITEYLNAVALMEDFIQTGSGSGTAHQETFAATWDETVASLVKSAVKSAGKEPVTMTREEKIQLVAGLESQGAFMIKGAVEYVAQRMGVSKFTVYSYLKEARASGTT